MSRESEKEHERGNPVADLDLGGIVLDERDLKKEKLNNTFRGAALAFGSAIWAYPLLESLSEPISLGTRYAIGMALGTLYAYGMNRVAHQVVQRSDPGFARLYRGASIAAFLVGASGLTWGLGTDFSRNADLMDSVGKEDSQWLAYERDPESLLKLEEKVLAAHEEIIRTIDGQGSLSPKALAELALYFDAQNLDTGLTLTNPDAVVDTFHYEPHMGSKWTIDYMGSGAWYVSGPTFSYAIGGDAQGKSALNRLNEVGTSESSYLAAQLDKSSLMDGRTYAQDLLSGITVSAPTALVEGLDSLHAFAPFEWNHHFRDHIRDHVHSVDTEEMDTLEQEIERNFSGSTGSSYQQTLQTLNTNP